MAPTEMQTHANATPDAAKKDLSSWWKNFKRGGEKRREDDRGESSQETQEPQGIFGVPLATSVRYANVAISLSDNNGQSYIYGYVPIVVAKCGVYLKEKATDVEGIFRLSGSEKRIKELRNSFNSPDRYGKGLDWSGYTVHDAANILRRYFNQLPEPIIPLDFYDKFRNPLRNHQSQAVGPMEGQSPCEGDFSVGEAIITYQGLIKQLPPLNRQLLLYILDLLAVFASKADQNKMTTPNLAAIFQPGILSHPAHDMAPPEYRLSQDVLIFLIEHQDHFLIGMQGTAADEKTVQEVESGPPTPSHHSSNARSAAAATVVRSLSNSSKHSGVRRSASASSRRSRTSVGMNHSPIGSELHTPTGGVAGSGVHRSNTLPHSRSPNLTHARFGKEKLSGALTPPAIQEVVVAESNQPSRPTMSIDSKLHSQPLLQEVMTPAGEHMMSLPKSGPIFDQHMSTKEAPAASREVASENTLPNVTTSATTHTIEPASPQSASTSRPLSSFFAGRSPPTEARKPNKLQKKRSPLPSAHSSTHSLNEPNIEAASMASMNSSVNSQAFLTPRADNRPIPLDQLPLKSPPPIGENMRPNASPTTSNMSVSDAEQPSSHDLLSASYESKDGSHLDAAKRKHWFTRSKDGNPPPSLGSNGQAANSRSSVLSSEGGRKSINLEGRRSVQMDRIPSGTEQNDFSNAVISDTEREGRKSGNPVKWLKGKLQDRADKRDRSRDDKRLASPSRGDSVTSETYVPQNSISSVVSPHKSAVPSFTGPEHAANGATPTTSTSVDAGNDLLEKKTSTPDTIVPVTKELSSLPEEGPEVSEASEIVEQHSVRPENADVATATESMPLPAPAMAVDVKSTTAAPVDPQSTKAPLSKDTLSDIPMSLRPGQPPAQQQNVRSMLDPVSPKP